MTIISMIYLGLLLSIVLCNARVVLVAKINSGNITLSFVSTEKIFPLDISLPLYTAPESISSPSRLITLLYPLTLMNILC